MCTGAEESRGVRSGDDRGVSKVVDTNMNIAMDDNNNNIEDHEEDDDISTRRNTTCITGKLDILPQGLSLSQVKEELQSLAKTVSPIMMTTLLLYSRTTISILFLGRQGTLELAGGSLAIGFANITATSILKGLTMGMDPLCSQAYGAKTYHLLSQTFLKTLSLLLFVSIPISLLWFHITPILLFLGQDPKVTHIAQIYLLFSIPELIAQAFLNPLRSFLRTQNLNLPLTLSASVSLILHIPINYFLSMKFGVKGVALATGFNSMNMIIGLMIYLVVSDKPVKPWKLGASSSCFFTLLQNWKPLISLALPSCFSVCLEWWWYEIMLFLCGLLRNPETTVATMGILIQTCGFLYVFPFSISSALTIKIGHSVGAGEAYGAERAAIVGVVLAFTFGVTAFGFLVCVRDFLGKMFTKDKDIVELVRITLPILGLGEIGNWPQTASCGVLSGTSRPYVGARINLCAFYLIGLPVGVLGGFVYGFGFLGLWYGMVAAQMSCFFMMVWAFLRTDWGHYSRKMEMELAKVGEYHQINQNHNDDDDEESGALV